MYVCVYDIRAVSACAAREGRDPVDRMMRSHLNKVKRCLLKKGKQKTANYRIVISTVIESM